MVKELSVADQTVTVDAGIGIERLQAELRDVGMTLPFGEDPFRPPTLRHALEWGLPHTLEAQAGGWRDWVLGAIFEAGDGTRFRAGAKVVKSVAGYDLHRFLVGCRGYGARWEEVTLRLFPLGSVPASVAERRSEQPPRYVIRTPRSRFAEAAKAGGVALLDPASSTLWTTTEIDPLGGWRLDVRAPISFDARTRTLLDALDPEGRWPGSRTEDAASG